MMRLVLPRQLSRQTTRSIISNNGSLSTIVLRNGITGSQHRKVASFKYFSSGTKMLYSDNNNTTDDTESEETQQASEKEEEEEEEEEGKRKGKESTEPKSAADSWLEEHKAEYPSTSEEPISEYQRVNYLGTQNIPFPANPLFRVEPPIPDKRKESIYHQYLQNPEENTARRLALQHKLSIRRVEAILKLKMLEKHMLHQNIPLQDHFQTSMEQLLGASVHREPEEMEIVIPKVRKPLFKTIEEDEHLTPEDAAKILQRKPYQKDTDLNHGCNPRGKPRYIRLPDGYQPSPVASPSSKVDEQSSKLVNSKWAPIKTINPKSTIPQQQSSNTIKIFEHNEQTQNPRWTYLFTDLNPKLPFKARATLVRERSGTLRESTRAERRLALDKQWPEKYLKHMV